MCGIYASAECGGHSPEVVFAGLKRVEYRGYDSWGVAVAKPDEVKVYKEVGKMPNSFDLPTSDIAIGHTRWATHGGVTRENAHPHPDCLGRLALVHNGVVENFLQLKDEIKDHAFKSQTDSEVIAHLIETELRRGVPLSLATRLVFSRLEGLNAVLVTDGQKIVGISGGSPMVVGKTDNGFVASSDNGALSPYTKNTYRLEKNEMVVLNHQAFLTKLKDGPLEDVPFTIHTNEYEEASLDSFPHFMLKEIHQQPKTWQRLLENSTQITETVDILKNTPYITLLGCGSAHYAAMTGKYLFAKYANRRISTEPASEFDHFSHLLSPDDAVVAISQSGETIDLLEQTRHAQELGAKVIAIVNSEDSSLDRESESQIHLNAGLEKAVLATKSLTQMIGSLILLATELGGDPELGRQIIKDSIKAAEDVLLRGPQLEAIAKSLAHNRNGFILGRGLSYPLAMEGALKTKEGSYTQTEGFAGGELKHGVMALIEEGTPVFVLAPNDETQKAILSNAQEVKARGAHVIGIGAQNNPVFSSYFHIPEVGASSIMPTAVALQLLGYYYAIAKDTDPDKPRNLAKSVTVK